MPHVEQRLLVHRFVLEDREHCLGAVEQRISGPVEILALERLDHMTVGFLREREHGIPRWPSWAGRARHVGQVARVRLLLVRIDAAREHRFEVRVDAGAPEALLHHRVEAECRQVAFIEHERMPQRDRSAVIRLVCDEVEDRSRARAVAAIPVERRGTVQGHLSIFIRNGLEWASEIAHYAERRPA